MSGLVAGSVVRAAAYPLGSEPLPADQVVEGSPATGTAELGTFDGLEVGIWEMTPGTATDVEVDEVFVVISGRARIAFIDAALEPLEVSAGDIVRLGAGMRTQWTVVETLRKVYLL